MNPDTGEIRDFAEFEKLFANAPEKLDNLVPFEVGEIVELKGCRFKVRSIHEHPTNIVTLEGIPKIDA